MQIKRTTRISAAALAAIIAASAGAGVIESDTANSESGLGLFTGAISYLADAPNHGTLTITLSNVSTPSNGGFITGFVFNIDSADPGATATLTSATHPFIGVTNHGAPPFGASFIAGAALGGNWAGSGSPSMGIGIGETGTFVFSVQASDAPLLDAASFASGPYDFNFIVRFRGFEDGGSDKTPGAATPIPGPATLCVLALGLLATRARKRAI